MNADQITTEKFSVFLAFREFIVYFVYFIRTFIVFGFLLNWFFLLLLPQFHFFFISLSFILVPSIPYFSHFNPLVHWSFFKLPLSAFSQVIVRMTQCSGLMLSYKSKPRPKAYVLYFGLTKDLLHNYRVE